jgi:hypothetical protein
MNVCLIWPDPDQNNKFIIWHGARARGAPRMPLFCFALAVVFSLGHVPLNSSFGRYLNIMMVFRTIT